MNEWFLFININSLIYWKKYEFLDNKLENHQSFNQYLLIIAFFIIIDLIYFKLSSSSYIFFFNYDKESLRKSTVIALSNRLNMNFRHYTQPTIEF